MGVFGTGGTIVADLFAVRADQRLAGGAVGLHAVNSRLHLRPLHEIVVPHKGDPLGRAFDHYLLNLAAPQAVRARTQQTTAALVAHCLKHGGETYRVVSVGSGPAIDVRDAVSLLPEEHRGRLCITFLEIDPKAIDFAREKLQSLLPAAAFECVCTNLFRLPQTAARDGTLVGTEAGIPQSHFDISSERLGVNLFLVARK